LTYAKVKEGKGLKRELHVNGSINVVLTVKIKWYSTIIILFGEFYFFYISF